MDPSESLENQTGDRHSTEEALKGGSKVAEASSQDAPADKNDKPTIIADHEAFKWDYYTCYGTWGQTYTNLISFLQKPNLPLIWQAQVHCNIGTMRVYSDEPQIPEFVHEPCLAKAERLLEEARRVHVHDPKDAATLMRLALRIEEGINEPDID
ncbi:hypothetical protein B0A48_17409 [Cryoendolithus antarcticus]|uniref:Uncharacterized protein n=1 Tax=Cryoendolithus antarcticus TaxID=1507870 RepID=A0A1V8SCG7_9PEZI|nr:hypothetical protein B0A48_17409 [Cryoendolithus antarcticus]